MLIRDGHLFQAGRLLNFHHFQQVVSLFCNETINNNKTEDVLLLKVNRTSRKFFIVPKDKQNLWYSFYTLWVLWVGGGLLFKTERLINFSYI